MLQLICLFTKEPELNHTLDMIEDAYEVVYKRVFVLSIQDSDELVCSFNIQKGLVATKVPGSMLVHRKKETNTMYTINSLNALIRQKNNGVLDQQFLIDWNAYRNSLLITSNNQLKILNTQVHDIISLG